MRMSSIQPATDRLLDMVKSTIPPLSFDQHKGQCGRIAIIGGSKEYTGAPYFAAVSALKVGADLSHIITTNEASPIIKSYSPELIVHPLLEESDAVWQVSEWLARMHAVVIGPGLGRNPAINTVVKGILDKCRTQDLPIVIDADGLFLLTEDPSLIKGYSKAILTPNIIEFSRLYEAVFHTTAKKNTVDEVVELSQALGNVTIVKKGKHDVIVCGNTVLLCTAEGSPRRCGGQGDLLSGSLGTFVHWAQSAVKHNVDNELLVEYGASVCAAYAACLLTRRCSHTAFINFGRSTTTTDLIGNIHRSFDQLFPTTSSV